MPGCVRELPRRHAPRLNHLKHTKQLRNARPWLSAARPVVAVGQYQGAQRRRTKPNHSVQERRKKIVALLSLQRNATASDTSHQQRFRLAWWPPKPLQRRTETSVHVRAVAVDSRPTPRSRGVREGRCFIVHYCCPRVTQAGRRVGCVSFYACLNALWLQCIAAQMEVAIVGATGAVGIEFMRVLEDLHFPVGELLLFASERSAGRKLSFRGRELDIKPLTDGCFNGYANT